MKLGEGQIQKIVIKVDPKSNEADFLLGNLIKLRGARLVTKHPEELRKMIQYDKEEAKRISFKGFWIYC